MLRKVSKMNPNAAGNAVLTAATAALATVLRGKCFLLLVQNVELIQRSHSVPWKVGQFTAKNASKDNGPPFNFGTVEILPGF
jgi:hypothetical protein